MSTPITLSGFNNIDFNSIITTLIQVQSQPITLAQQEQNSIQNKISSLKTFQTRIDSVKSKAQQVNSSLLFLGTTASSSATSVFTASSTESAPVANHTIRVNSLAASQTTVSSSTFGSVDDVVATGGSIVIGGKTITISESTTLQDFADQINSTSNIGVMASVVDTGNGAFKLVLNGKSSGTANAFTISSNNLTGGSGVAFTDTNHDGISGNTADDNTVNAKNSEVVIDGLTIQRATNTVTDALPGVTLSLLKEDSSNTHTLDVSRDTSSILSKVQDFISTYNDLASYVNAEYTIGTSTNEPGPLSGEAVLRTSMSVIRGNLRDEVGVGGTFSRLSEVGITFDQTGNLVLDSTKFSDSIDSNPADVQKLFQGTESTDGVFGKLVSSINSLTASDGIMTKTRENFDNSVNAFTTQILDLQQQIDVSRKALVQQFAAVDQLMSQYNSYTTMLTNLQSA